MSDPALPAPDSRLRSALAAALALAHRWTTPRAVIAGGSIVRAAAGGPAPDAGSDFDIFVLHDAPWRQRVQRRVEGVACEFFINPMPRLARYLIDERASGRPVTAHLLSTGVVVYDPDSICPALIAQAHAELARGWRLDAEQLTLLRYMAASLIEDAHDAAARDPVASELLLGRALDALVTFAFAKRGLWLPRPKERASSLGTIAPQQAIQLAACFGGALGQRLERATILAAEVLGTTGFFDWDSERRCD